MALLPAYIVAKPNLRIVVRVGGDCAGYNVAPSEIGGIDQAFLQVKHDMHGELTMPGRTPGLALMLQRVGFALFASGTSPAKRHAMKANC